MPKSQQRDVASERWKNSNNLFYWKQTPPSDVDRFTNLFAESEDKQPILFSLILIICYFKLILGIVL